MVYSTYKQLRILFYYFKGYWSTNIHKCLMKEGMITSRSGICKFIRRYKETGSIGRRPGSGRPSKITEEIKQIVEEQMKKDDETSAFQLHALLLSRGHYLSIRTILRCRTTLGWTFRGTAYCQLIREPNKLKRLEWAQKYLNEAEHGFMDVVWSDECTVQLETHRRFSCHKRGEPPKHKPR